MGIGQGQGAAGVPIVRPGEASGRRRQRLIGDAPAALALAAAGGQADEPVAALFAAAFRAGRFGLLAFGTFTSGAMAALGWLFPSRFRLPVALPRFVPTAAGLGCVGRRFDPVGPRPSQFFLGRVTAAMPPALLGAATAAGMVLTGKRNRGVFGGEDRQRRPDYPRDVPEKRHRDDKASSNLRNCQPSPRSHSWSSSAAACS